MRELIVMSRQELDRSQVLQRVVDRRLSQHDAATVMGITDRQCRRLVAAYRAQGATGVVSRKRGKPSNRAAPATLKRQAMDLIHARYEDFGPTLAAEKLAEEHSIMLSRETLRQWMIEEGIWLSRAERRKRIYQPRYRRDCFGELIQIDGSEHYWFEERGPQCTLLVFIDDATGRLVQLRFVDAESTFDYFHATRGYIERYGKPVAFYSDKHSVFRVNQVGATTGNGMTQFGRALHELNIDIICANSSQAKGRVERANKTLQDRLVKELRLRGISTIADANQFMPQFIEAFNVKFAKPPFNATNLHRPVRDDEDLDFIFSWQEERTITNSLTVQYDRVVYLLDPNHQIQDDLRRKRVTIYDFPDGTVDIRYKGFPLTFSVFDKVRQVKQAEIVSNKRLGAALRLAQEIQAENPVRRSASAPVRHGQIQVLAERVINPAIQG